VTISVGVYLVLWLFKLVLYCVGVCMCGFCNVLVMYALVFSNQPCGLVVRAPDY